MQAHVSPGLANDPANSVGRILPRSVVLTLAAALAGLGVATAANAEVRVSGTADAIVVQAKAATLTDALPGLAAVSHARIELKGATSRQFTGTYSGSLHAVLSRLLIGVDHIVHSAGDRITIIIVAPNPTHAVAVAWDNGGNSNVQGWMPARPPVTSAAASAPAPAVNDAPERTSGVQGWMPTTVQVASNEAPNPAAAPLGAATTNADEPTSGVQGWMPTSIAGLAQPPPAAALADGAPQGLASDDGDGPAGGVQGWVPTAARPD